MLGGLQHRTCEDAAAEETALLCGVNEKSGWKQGVDKWLNQFCWLILPEEQEQKHSLPRHEPDFNPSSQEVRTASLTGHLVPERGHQGSMSPP